MKGKVVSWNDDKGFGFITPEDQSERVFFHISSVKKASRKPSVGDVVVFDVTRDPQNRLKASHVLLEGVPLANQHVAKSIVTDTVKKDGLDYCAYFVLAVLFMLSAGLLIKTGSPDPAIVPGVLFLVILLFISNRKKQPANALFSCAKCGSVASHDDRTVLAWNRGFNKLYCKSCHQVWLSQHPEQFAQSSNSRVSSRSGCLGLLVVIGFFPVFCIVSAIQWFV